MKTLLLGSLTQPSLSPGFEPGRQQRESFGPGSNRPDTLVDPEYDQHEFAGDPEKRRAGHHHREAGPDHGSIDIAPGMLGGFDHSGVPHYERQRADLEDELNQDGRCKLPEGEETAEFI